jgi:hypothetical protein
LEPIQGPATTAGPDEQLTLTVQIQASTGCPLHHSHAPGLVMLVDAPLAMDLVDDYPRISVSHGTLSTLTMASGFQVSADRQRRPPLACSE